MKIEHIETLRADAGWRMFSYLKISTACGITGWSEFNESFGSTGLADVINGLAPVLIGKDPRRFEAVTQHLHVLTRQSRGGINQQAIAAIENALLDITGKAYGVPVSGLFGGPVRERIPVYWSHFGTYRVRSAALMGVPPIDSYDDARRACRRGEGARLPGAENQHPADRGRQAGELHPRLRPHPGLARAELGQPPDRRGNAAADDDPRGDRAGDGIDAGRQLPLQDRRLPPHRRSGGAGRPHLARDRHP